MRNIHFLLTTTLTPLLTPPAVVALEAVRDAGRVTNLITNPSVYTPGGIEIDFQTKQKSVVSHSNVQFMLFVIRFIVFLYKCLVSVESSFLI